MIPIRDIEEAIERERKEREEKKLRAKLARERKVAQNGNIIHWMDDFAKERKIELSDELIAAREKKNPSDKATLEFAWEIMRMSDAASITEKHGAALRRLSGLFYKHLVTQVRAEHPDIAKADLKEMVFSKMSAIPAAHNVEKSQYVKDKFEWESLADIYNQLFDY